MHLNAEVFEPRVTIKSGYLLFFLIVDSNRDHTTVTLYMGMEANVLLKAKYTGPIHRRLGSTHG